jgi:predicted nucleic acid-binding protein
MPTFIVLARLKVEHGDRREKNCRPMTLADAWVRAAAPQLNVPLATHNASDYAAVDDLVLLTAAPAV